MTSALLTIKRAHIPGNVVAPANCLNPVNSSSIDPYQVSWTLDEAVHGYVCIVQVLQHWPPGPSQVVHTMPEYTGRKEKKCSQFKSLPTYLYIIHYEQRVLTFHRSY